MNRTYSPRASDIERSWFVVDATGQRLGTLASRVAQVLAGKHKPTYATHMDVGDHVIVLNAARIDVGGGKTEQKLYSRHSGYPGGLRQETLGQLLERRPEEVIRRAVKGMLPRNRLGAQQLRKLKVYAGGEHPHEAQLPAALPGVKSTAQAPAAAAAPKAKAETSEDIKPATAAASPTDENSTADEGAQAEESAQAEETMTSDDKAKTEDNTPTEETTTGDAATGGSDK